MSTIHLIRHGEKKLEPGNPGLTDLGVQQAIQTGNFLNNFSVSQLIASPLKRTKQTAQYIAKQLKLDYTTNDLLIERMIWDDPSVSRTKFLKEWIEATKHRNYVPKWGDSSYQTGKRVTEVIDNLKLAAEDHAVVVTHGGAIIDYLRNILGDKAVQTLVCEYELGQDYQMLHCSINTVEIDENNQIIRLNYSKHLSAKTE